MKQSHETLALPGRQVGQTEVEEKYKSQMKLKWTGVCGRLMEIKNKNMIYLVFGKKM